jgi:glutathione S-transferase
MVERPTWMGPSVTIHEALRSDAKRRERDLELARWCGLSEDEVGPFLRRLRLFDARTEGWEITQAAEEAKLRRLDADLADFWRTYGPPEAAT